MRNRVLAPLGAVTLLMVVVLWAPVLVEGQTPSGTTAVTADWTPPRTPWGDPDLKGYWLYLTYAPLERPAELAGKPFFTQEEAVEAFKKSIAADYGVDPTTVHYDWKEYGMDAWQSPVRLNLRTSLIVDPPDGRLPPLTPEAQKRRAAATAAARARGTDVQTPGMYTRCITGNGGPPKIPGGVTAESQIVQTPGYVVLIQQSNNDVRIVPLDGRPHLPHDVRQWLGDARGHFEGNTLVVETTNFNDKSQWRGSTDALHLVERFTLVDAKTLRYEFTVTDPTTWTRPWSIEGALPRIEPPLYEFACHEENYGLINFARGAQAREAEAAAKGQPKPSPGGADER